MIVVVFQIFTLVKILVVLGGEIPWSSSHCYSRNTSPENFMKDRELDAYTTVGRAKENKDQHQNGWFSRASPETSVNLKTFWDDSTNNLKSSRKVGNLEIVLYLNSSSNHLQRIIPLFFHLLNITQGPP